MAGFRVIAVALAALAAGIVALTLGRFDRKRAIRRWDFVLSGRAEAATANLRARLLADTDIASHIYDLALDRRASLSFDEAVRLLGIAADTLEEGAQKSQTRLRAFSIYSRMARAIVPVPPLRPSQFRLRELRSLTGVGAWLHELLASYGERFRFRLVVIAMGFRLVIRRIRGGRLRAAGGPRGSEPFDNFGDSLHDFKELDVEQVESLRQLLFSVSAIERGTPHDALRSSGDASASTDERKKRDDEEPDE